MNCVDAVRKNMCDHWCNQKKHYRVFSQLATYRALNFPSELASHPSTSGALLTAAAAPAATFQTGLKTIIEGYRIADFRWGTVSAKPVVLRFGFKAPAGTYGVSLIGGASWLGNIVITAGQANTDTEQIFIIPASTAGTWNVDNSSGIQLQITLAAGSSIAGGTLGWTMGMAVATAAQTNGMTSTSNVFELFDVGLYADPYATGIPPAWQLPDFAAEKLLCKRYYFSETYAPGNMFIPPIDLTNIYRRLAVKFPVEMCKAPIVTVTASVSGTFAAGSPNGTGASVFGVEVNGDLTGAGYAYMTALKANARL